MQDLDVTDFDDDDERFDHDKLMIRGQVIYMTMWKKIFFIGVPVMDGLGNLVANGLFINDLSMHDYSRDLMIASCQYKVSFEILKR